MPKGVSEISQGNQFSRSANEGQLADAATRTFRIILNSPSEVFDIQATCGVFVGDAHPTNTNIACTSFDAKYDGDSRTVLVATFNYASEAAAQDVGGGGGGGGPKTISPDIRPANWSISTELTEAPLRQWALRTGQNAWGSVSAPINPARDAYEGVTTLIPVVNINVSQFVLGGSGDPTRHAMYAGTINSETLVIGSLIAEPHTLMLRGINATPTVESWGRLVMRGWNVEYTFSLKTHRASVSFLSGGEATDSNDINLGWDAAIIVEGRNVICFAPGGQPAYRYAGGQPLKVGDDKNVLDPANPELPDGVEPGDKSPAMLKIQGFGERAFSQVPAAEPVAINLDGTARSPDLDPIIRAYQIYPAIDMLQVLQLRLY